MTSPGWPATRSRRVLITTAPWSSSTASRRRARRRGCGGRGRFLALAGDRPSLEDGERVLAEARSLGTTEEHLNAWINLGLARNRQGDLRGLDDLAGALDQALAANSHVAARAYVNLASMANTLGDLPRGRELHREGLAVAQRFGSGLERWLVSECVLDDYHAGDWDLAVPAARELADRSTVERQYMDVGPSSVLAGVALARGDDAAARTYASGCSRAQGRSATRKPCGPGSACTRG